MGHEEGCEKIEYEGGICTCDLIRDARANGDDRDDDGGALELAMEDYEGPAMDG